MPRPRRTRKEHARSLTALILLMLCAIAPASAQDTPIDLDGRGFSGVNLPQPIESYGLEFRAVRGYTWREAGAIRLALRRDVTVRIGLYTFRASSASVWLELIEVDGREAVQVAAYFTDVLSPAPDNGIDQRAETLLVTAVTLEPETTLALDDRIDGRPSGGDALALVEQGEARFARHLASLIDSEGTRTTERPTRQGRPTGAGEVIVRTPDRDGTPDQIVQFERPEWMLEDDRETIPTPERADPIDTAPRGSVTFDATDISYRSRQGEGDAGPVILLEGGFALQYRVPDRPQAVQLRSDSAVIFLKESADAGGTRYRAEDVEGVYLEGGVTIDATAQSMRARKVYYDIATERGIIIDGVFRAENDQLGNPVYVRAESIRQLSINQWRATDVSLTNVSFAEPHFAIGATDVTITREQRDGATRTLVDADGVSFRAGDTAILTLPRIKGELKPSPLREVSAGREANSAVVRTEWDLYTLLGIEGPAETQASLLLDGYLERGVGIGLDYRWATEDFEGSLLAYYAYTAGEDELTSGAEFDPQDEHRGVILGENIWRLDSDWTLFTELSYISDETFIDAFFENQAETRREFINSVRARYQDDRSVFSIEVRASFNDFIANEYLLQSLGYNTERLPEARYSTLADNLFGDLISYSTDTRVGLVRLNFNEVTAAEQGFDTLARAASAFGILPTDTLAAGLRARGLTEDEVARFDTRHEIEIPLRAGAVNIVPFAVGRLTAYDDDFDTFAGSDEDPYRLWGAAGVRAGTSLQRTDSSFTSEIFDLNGIRHIIEPEVALWHASTSLSQEDLPVFDDGVESIAQGTVFQAAITNTWQTKRGRNQRSVDWLSTRTSYQWSSSEVDPESPFGRYISYRPEHSNLGRFFRNETIWNVSDSLALINDISIDTDEGRISSNVIGALVDHGLGFQSFVEYRELDPIDAAFLRVGARQEVTVKYALGLAGEYNFTESEFQSVTGFVTRRFPQWTVEVGIGFNSITNNLGFGVSLRPVGFGSEKRFRSFASGLTAQESIGALRSNRGRLNRGPFADR